MENTIRCIVLYLACIGLLIGDARSAQAQQFGTYEIEFFGGSTLKLEGSRAVVSIFEGRAIRAADSGQHTVLPSIGMSVSKSGRVFGSFMDFSYVEGGKASASIGSSASEVSSGLFDFHGGVQAQFAGTRVRPYVLAGGGFARTSTDSTLTLFGRSTHTNQSEWLSSVLYGGGVRIGLSDSVGIRVGLEGITVSPIRSDSSVTRASYGRFTAGMFLLGRSQRATPVTPPTYTPTRIARELDGVQDALSEIRGGPHGVIPPATVSGRNPSGVTTLVVTNTTSYRLSVFLSGPDIRELSLAVGDSERLAVTPGQYEIGAAVSAPNVLRFHGTQEFVRGNAYEETFYIGIR